MKKMFLSAIVAVLALGMTANAKPRSADYDDDESEYAEETSSSYDDEASDEDEAPRKSKKKVSRDEESDNDEDMEEVADSARKRIAEEESDDEDEEDSPKSKKKGKKVAQADDDDDDDDEEEEEAPKKKSKMSNKRGNEKPYNLGVSAGIGYVGMYNKPENTELADKIYQDFLGLGFRLGGAAQLRLGSMFSVVAELDFGMKFFTQELVGGTYYDYETGDYEEWSLDENIIFMNLEIPLVARINFTPNIYVEGGVKLGFNVAVDHTISASDATDDASVGVSGGTEVLYDVEYDPWDETVYYSYNMWRDWIGNSFNFSVIFGGGYSFDLPKLGKNDIGLRVTIDMTDLEDHKDHNDMMSLLGWSDMEIHTKTWSIELYYTMWLK